MKSLQILIAICFISLTVNAAGTRYQEAMLSNLELLNHANGNEDYLNCANRFERIAAAEKTEWLPYYYASYSCILISFNETDNTKKDLILDRAQQLLDSAFAINGDESELYVLQAFLYPSRITVDPVSRGMVYMDKCFQSLETAKSLNPGNPRIYFLEGIMKVHLPESMGGGTGLAKSLFTDAKIKFETFQPENSLMPVWGAEANRSELEKISGEGVNNQ